MAKNAKVIETLTTIRDSINKVVEKCEAEIRKTGDRKIAGLANSAANDVLSLDRIIKKYESEKYQ